MDALAGGKKSREYFVLISMIKKYVLIYWELDIFFYYCALYNQ